MPHYAAVPDNPGADHVSLEGAASSFRFRSERVPAGQLSAEAVFQFVFEGVAFGPLTVLDLSSTGLGVRPSGMFMPQGAVLESASLTYHGAVVWTGTAAVVYQVEGTSPRLGVRFVSSVLNVERIHARDSILQGGLSTRLDQLARARAELPAYYRAEVSDLCQLLIRSRQVLTEVDRDRNGEREVLRPQEREIVAAVHESWAPLFYGQLRDLFSLSRSFSSAQRELSKDYCAQLLMPQLRACPMHRRAYEKPFGYAGDYVLMRLYFSEHSPAESLYGRMLHYTAQRYTLGRSVVARERNMREVVRELVARGEPVRIVSLACGPAIELGNLLAEVQELGGSTELILVDQDEAALAYCHRELSARLTGHPAGPQVNLHCLHFSVRQLLKPRNQAEQRVLEKVLSDVDLIYSGGLFDYLPRPVARNLLSTLFRLLRPGGRLFVGNLCEAADTTWMMEHVLSWHLEYRGREDLLDLANAISGPGIEAKVVSDSTGYCLFLQVDKP